MNNILRLFKSQTGRDTLVSFTGLGITAGVGTLFTVLMARGLEPATFGVFSALVAFVGILSSMGDFGISAALVNFLPKVKDKREILVSISFWFQLGVSLIIALLLASLGVANNRIVPGSHPVQFTLIGILTGIYILQGLSLGIFNAEKKFFSSSFVQASDSAIKMGIVAALFFSKKLNIEFALIANIISCTLSIVYGLGRELRNIRPVFPRAQVTEIFKFAKWVALSRIFSVAISRIDIIILNLLAGSFETGIYAAASRITLLFALLVSSISSVIAPRFSAFKQKAEVLKYLKKTTLLVIGVCGLMLLTLIVADPLVRIVYGTKYIAAIPVFRAITVAMIPFLLAVITTTPLIYTYNKPSFFARLTIIQVTTIIVLDILLIPQYKALAPAISLAVSNLILFVVSGVKLADELNKHGI